MTVPALRSTSPVTGLRRRRLGRWDVLAQSVAATAPAAAMATSPGQALALAGSPPSALAYLVATVLVLLVSSCVGQFSRRMVAPGSLYSFTAKGLGPTAATVAGGSLVVGYGFLVAGALTGASMAAAALVGHLVPVPDGPVPLVAGVLLAALLVAAPVVRGAGVSARLALTLEAVAISAVAVVLVVVVVAAVRAGAPGPAGVGVVLDGGGHPFGPGGQGLLLAVTAFVGFESAGALASESRRPFSVVPWAVRTTALGAGLLYVLAAAAQAVVFAGTPGLGATPLPLAEAVRVLTDPRLVTVLELGVLTSFAGCASGSLTALVRLVFTTGREGVAPRALGRTGRWGTPATAVAWATAVAAAVPAAVLAAGVPVADALRGLLVVSTCGYVGAYVLVCCAAPVFLRRIGELTALPVLVAVVATASLVAVLAACTAWALAAGGGWVLVAAALLVAAVVRALALRRWRPDLLTAVGLYDETRQQDVLQ
ncbi:APC family permease [Kineococcus aurantiacus]|uniref:Amino acid transporter n=1 Tax=Kineococcus aurantiacus TaxID=37633 RepID=A0A7Y9DJX2_9ACTN|nr:amino acid transporter [Kineococcus aurantiacus]